MAQPKRALALAKVALRRVQGHAKTAGTLKGFKRFLRKRTNHRVRRFSGGD